MPINHSLEVIFIHIPKTGGTSIEYTLGMHGEKSDIGIVPYLNQTKNFQFFFGEGLQHLTSSEIKRILSGMHFNDYTTGSNVKRFLDRFFFINKKRDVHNLWNSYTSFSVVRNPYDRLVSYLAWRETQWNGSVCFNKHCFSHFVRNELTERMINNKRHLWPQHKFIFQNGKPQVNFILKFENLQNDFKTMMERIGLMGKELFEKRMVSRHSDYHDYYTPELLKIVYDFYKDDFELFGYKKEF